MNATFLSPARYTPRSFDGPGFRACVWPLAFLSLLLWTCGKGKPAEGEWPDMPGTTLAESVDDYGYTARYQQMPDGTRHGRYKLFNSQGQLYELAEYRHGMLHGARVLFQESGDTLSVEHYVNDAFEGPFRAFYPSGQLELAGSYTDNRMEGVWRRYYENGRLMEEVTFFDNKENGPFVEYHPNGKRKAEGTYLDGDNEHGTLLLYDENGKLERRMECDRGICRTQWQASEGGKP